MKFNFKKHNDWTPLKTVVTTIFVISLTIMFIASMWTPPQKERVAQSTNLCVSGVDIPTRLVYYRKGQSQPTLVIDNIHDSQTLTQAFAELGKLLSVNTNLTLPHEDKEHL